MELSLVDQVAMALCVDRHGSLESGSWAKRDEASRNYFRKAARAVLDVPELKRIIAIAKDYDAAKDLGPSV